MNRIRHGAGVMSLRLRVAPGAAMCSRPPAVSRAGMRPTAAQRRYLKRGLDQPDGKLPLFDAEGQAIDRKTIDSCVEHGWAEPWIRNPQRPDWVVCKLTPAGYVVVGRPRPLQPG